MVSHSLVRGNLLWIEVEVCSIHLVESPKEILGGTIYIIATGVIWEIIAQGRPRELLPE